MRLDNRSLLTSFLLQRILHCSAKSACKMPARARLAVLGAWLWCASTCCGGLRPGTAPWVRSPPMGAVAARAALRLRGGAEPPSSSRKAFGIDSYVASEVSAAPPSSRAGAVHAAMLHPQHHSNDFHIARAAAQIWPAALVCVG